LILSQLLRGCEKFEPGGREWIAEVFVAFALAGLAKGAPGLLLRKSPYTRSITVAALLGVVFFAATPACDSRL